MLNEWVKRVWLLGTKGGGGKIGGGGGGCGGGWRTLSSSTIGWFSAWCMITSSRPSSNKSKSMALITGSIKGSLGFSRLRFFRNDEIGFGGLGSTANMFLFGVLKEAPMVGSRGRYNGSLSFFFFFFFLGEGSFCGLAWEVGLCGNGYVMAGRVPLVLKGL